MKATLKNILHLYTEGFRNMTWGRTLWLLIFIKLFIMFFILRLFFFPDFLNEATDGNDKNEYVSRELIRRAGGAEASPSD